MKERHYSAPVAAKSATGCRSPSITPCTSAQLFLGVFCCPVFMAAVRGHASAWPAVCPVSYPAYSCHPACRRVGWSPT
ncbi:ash family protein [Pseudomonas chlororaphis]|nr:ash family protein [Pseudomonas chlororaphis]QTT95669.1 ash family protein [Pseudomonas chlororaphis]